MEIDFYKLHCLSDDIILVNYMMNSQVGIYKFARLARQMCSRHTGIGAQGVLFLTDTTREIPEGRYFTSEGEERGDHYDAVVCLSRYLFDSGLIGPDTFAVRLSGTEHTVDVIDSNNFRIYLGAPRNPDTGEELQVAVENDYTIPVDAGERQYPFSPVSIGRETHLVHISDIWNRKYLRGLSRKIHALHGETNTPRQTVFLYLLTRETCRIAAWTHERTPLDFLSLCGAAGTAGVMNGLMDRDADMELHGETVFFQWSHSTQSIMLTASASYLFTGTYEVPESLISPEQ